MIETIIWQSDELLLLDQRKLPLKEQYVHCRTYSEAVEAIFNLTVRGAPLIGVTAAMGMALGAKNINTNSRAQFEEKLLEIKKKFAKTRPTAKNLFWALEKMISVLEQNPNTSIEELKELLIKKANEIKKDDDLRNYDIGKWGASLFEDGDRVLTHCNAGALATAGPYGTALAPIRAAIKKGLNISVFSDETRPVLQGARLTSWECKKDNIPVTVITDNSAGYLMSKGMIDKVIVGADRIAKNGDVANKIGTYSVAVLAKNHGIPFYVAAPLSTYDFSLESGNEIPIEQRDENEVHFIQNCRITPTEVKVLNFAFDVTPVKYISALISEEGIAKHPFTDTLKQWEMKSHN